MTNQKVRMTLEQRNEEYHHIISELMVQDPITYALYKLFVNTHGYGEKLSFDYEMNVESHYDFFIKYIKKVKRQSHQKFPTKIRILREDVRLTIDTGFPATELTKLDIFINMVNDFSEELMGSTCQHVILCKPVIHNDSLHLTFCAFDTSAINHDDLEYELSKLTYEPLL
jgi:hypothetical protein